MTIELNVSEQIELIALCTAKKLRCEQLIRDINNKTAEFPDNFLKDTYEETIKKMDSLINLLQP